MNCPPKVRSALKSVQGVESAEVDYDSKTATVTCDGRCDTDALVAALKRAGYGGSVQ